MKRVIHYVEFLDHSSSSSWLDHKEIQPDTEPCYATGFVVFEDKTQIVLGNFLCDSNNESHARVRIMKGCITRRLKFVVAPRAK